VRKLGYLPDQEIRVQDRRGETICVMWEEKKINTPNITLGAQDNVLISKVNF